MTLSELARLPARLAWLTIAAAALILAVFVLGKCSRGDEVRKARTQADIAEATGEALDMVAEETPAIRRDQEEKQREVDEITGADQRLPDGFGAELERVRRGQRQPDDPR